MMDQASTNSNESDTFHTGLGTMSFLHGRLQVIVKDAKIHPSSSGAASRPFLKALNCLIHPGKKTESVAPFVTLKLTCNDGDPDAEVHVGRTAAAKVEMDAKKKTPSDHGDDLHVTWDQPFDVLVAHEVRDLSVMVKDKANGSALLGRTKIRIKDICAPRESQTGRGRGTCEGWLPLFKGELHDELQETGFTAIHGRNSVGSIRLSISFTSAEEERQNWSEERNNFWEITRAFYPARTNCRVRLYQDAYVPEGTLSDIPLTDKLCTADGGRVHFHPKGASRSIFESIANAERMVFILGWSMDINLKAVDEGTEKGKQEGVKLGELLKRKAQQGVEVRVMLWSLTPKWMKPLLRAKTSVAGLNQEALAYFRGSQVQCALIPRKNTDPKLSLTKRLFSRYAFTHHSKFVITDAPPGKDPKSNNGVSAGGSAVDGASLLRHELICYLGGMDLSTEDHDTSRHTHFDGHGKKFDLWHDVHCHIEGPAVWDVLASFEGQWRKLAVPQFRSTGLCGRPAGDVSGRMDDTKIPPLMDDDQWRSRGDDEDTGVELREIAAPVVEPHRSDVPMDWRENASEEKGGETGAAEIHAQVSDGRRSQSPAAASTRNGAGVVEEWHVQVFRSMDAESTDAFPDSMQAAFNRGLACEGGLAVDRGVHASYVHAIRRAEKFIYLENQFFDGASYAWDTHKKAKAHNIVPLEIALKVAQKIEADEPFRAYILIPLQPQLTKQARKAVRRWQWLTIKMMYRVVLDAMRRKGGSLNEMKPQDFLGVYCLGNREPSNPEYENGLLSKACRCGQQLPDKSKLFLVHSKMLLVDDEYINIGSANANDRSLDGSRDTEIAVAAWQPYHAWPRNKASPNGGGGRVTGGSRPRGEVYGFRMSLWEEHLGSIEPEFEQPWSLECIRRVNALAEERWGEYMAKGKGVGMKGHLMPFPMAVGNDGVTKERVRYVPHAFRERLAGGHTYIPHAATV